MIKLITDADVYTPKYIGKCDVLILDEKIAALDSHIEINTNCQVDIDIINGQDLILVPGFIDNHVHIIGGGGEGGFNTRTPEINISEIVSAGVTTLVGCLGTDGITRSMTSLLAKARALEELGLTTFIYTGSYRLPLTCLTGDIMKDIICVDKIIGCGEIAVSDHRSSQPLKSEIEKLAADSRVAGILSGKSGIINLHVGDGKRMLEMIFKIIEETEIPITQFLPTHINRNSYLLEEGIKYAKNDGYVDFTTSSDIDNINEGEYTASKALKKFIDAGISTDQISFSSDSQGSLPAFNEKNELIGLKIGNIASIHEEVQNSVLKENIPLESVIKVVTSTPAKILRLKNKGRIEKGADADLVLLKKQDLSIDTVLSKGKYMVKNKNVTVKDVFI